MPDWTPLYVDLVEFVSDGRAGGVNVMAELKRRLRFAYKRGFEMPDLALFFLAMGCAPADGGIRGFRKRIKGVARRLAAVAGRATLPTSSAVSRGLRAADRVLEADRQVAWLLSEGSRVRNLVRSPLVQTRDAQGQGWTVLDFDPTVNALRQRALPEDEDLPAPRRRAASLCAPGYPGRHRGETQFSTAILSHTGAGLFVQVTTHPGNTPFAEALGTAAQAAGALVDMCDLPRSRCIMRWDGAGGYAAAMAAVSEEDIFSVTRLQHHAVFSEPGVAELLSSATWHDVPDSRSGPRRQATEMGEYTLREADQEAAAVLRRLVVSRFACPDGHKHGAGVVIGDFQYEAFATDLEASAWPAAETVALYYQRVGQENQFGQAVRQSRLGDVHSYDLHGQRLATALMMWVSNLRQVRAAAFVGDLGPVPEQQARPASPPTVAQTEPEAVPTATQMQTEPEAGPAGTEPTAVRTEVVPVPLASPSAACASGQAMVPSQAQLDVPASSAAGLVGSAEPAVDAGADDTAPAVPLRRYCPAGLAAPLHNTRQLPGRRCSAIYRVPAGTCASCPQRANCSRSSNPAFQREFSQIVPSSALANRQDILAAARAEAHPRPPRGRNPAPASCSPARWKPPLPCDPGPLVPAPPSLRPSVLLSLWQDHCARFAVEVHIIEPPPPPRPRPWVAGSTAERQRRRRTWAQRNDGNALRGTACVSLLLLESDQEWGALMRKAA